MSSQAHKVHRPSRTKKKAPPPQGQINKKAFTFQSCNKAISLRQRNADRQHKHHHVPIDNRTDSTTAEVPPMLVAVVGPQGVGKTALVKALVKHFSKMNLVGDQVEGPITVVTGKNKRMTFIECPVDLPSMIDVAKTADLILLMVNGDKGFQMTTFEFLNIAKIHGFPRVMAVLTHLDSFKSGKALKKRKTELKHRLWTEIYNGAKVFYLSGMRYGRYLQNEVRNLARFLSIMKLRPLIWRNSHAYTFIDRVEDVTAPSADKMSDRAVAFYGYVRGTNLRASQMVHLLGVGDYSMKTLNILNDPCPLPEMNPTTQKRTSLKSKQRLFYAPMVDVGELLYDTDAVYINVKEYDNFESSTIIDKDSATLPEESLQQSSISLFNENDEFCFSDDESDSNVETDGEKHDLNILENPLESLSKKTKTLMDIVYGSSEDEKEIQHIDDNEDDLFTVADSDDDFFVPKNVGTEEFDKNREDSCKVLDRDDHIVAWEDEGDRLGIRKRFVTGYEDDDMEEEEEAEEELEEGMEEDSDSNEAEDLAQAKIQKKLDFDRQYDTEKSGEQDHYDIVKQQMSEQAQRNREAFSDIDEKTRLEHEGIPVGSYVRIEIDGLPCEFINNFRKARPCVIGALLINETKLGLLQARFKKHRWHDKILKNNDPLIFSIGWRRFQSIPVYSVGDLNGRSRMLKYTPEHMHCTATFYGPVSPPNTGVISFVSASEKKASFRVSGTGVIVEMNESFKIVKKVKLTGTPANIEKNTSFIKDMFTSSLEAAKMEGAVIRSVSGVRGQIKKAMTAKGQEGMVRATFEDKLLMSDIVFVRAWTAVEPKLFYNPMCSNLLDSEWEGMRTVSEIRRAENLTIPFKKDSEYKDIKRTERRFNPLRVPRQIQANLPYKNREKIIKKRKRKTLEGRRSVPLGQDEMKAVRLIKELQTIRKEKLEKRRQADGDRKSRKLAEKEKETVARSANVKKRKRMHFARLQRSKGTR